MRETFVRQIRRRRESVIGETQKPAQGGGFLLSRSRENETGLPRNPLSLADSMDGPANESPSDQLPLHQRPFGMVLEDRFDYGVERRILHRVA